LISAPAPALPLAPPIAEVVGQEDRGDGSHMLKLKMKSNRNAEALFLRFVVPIRLASMKLAGRNVAPAEGQINGLNLYAMGEQGVDLELVSSSPSINFWLMDRSDGLPVKASQRPAGLIAQNPSDVTFVCRKYSFPISDSQNPH